MLNTLTSPFLFMAEHFPCLYHRPEATSPSSTSLPLLSVHPRSHQARQILLTVFLWLIFFSLPLSLLVSNPRSGLSPLGCLPRVPSFQLSHQPSITRERLQIKGLSWSEAEGGGIRTGLYRLQVSSPTMLGVLLKVKLEWWLSGSQQPYPWNTV